jgi:hypothetical protein
MEEIRKLFIAIKNNYQLWLEWNDAIAWAKISHPNWVKLATQRKRPEIRETYRTKIIRAYCDRSW